MYLATTDEKIRARLRHVDGRENVELVIRMPNTGEYHKRVHMAMARLFAQEEPTSPTTENGEKE